MRAFDLAGVVVASVAATMLLVWAHAVHPQAPTAGVDHNGFWWWTDQSRYLHAAQAWAAGNLDPSRHWYLPGYPLMGALFVHVTPADPFLVPDAACMFLSVVLFGMLAGRLMPELPIARSLGASVFLVALAGSALMRDAWVVPWTTTPTTVLAYACVVVACGVGAPPSARVAFLAGLLAAAIGLFRPTDAVVVLLGVAPFMAASLLGFPAIGGRAIAVRAGWGACGAALPLVVVLLLHLAIYGTAPGDYVSQSRGTGFEWRLLPLRWVTLVISPRPLFPDGVGLVTLFPWFGLGCVGLVLGALGRLGGHVRNHALVAFVVALHMGFYLAYRDLHPQGLNHYGNDHYFKMVLPILALYAVLLAGRLVACPGRLAAGGIAIAAGIGMFCWRAEFHPLADGRLAAGRLPAERLPAERKAADTLAPRVLDAHVMLLRRGLDGPMEAVRVAAAGDFAGIYFGDHELRFASLTMHMNSDIKAFPEPGGFLLTVLRPPPQAPSFFVAAPAVTLETSPAPVIGHMAVVFGRPRL